MDATVVEARQTRNMSNATNNETTNTTVRPNDTTMMENQTVATTMNSMDSEDHENVFLTSLIDFLIEVKTVFIIKTKWSVVLNYFSVFAVGYLDFQG